MAEGGGDVKAGGSTPTVFISHASQDVAVANAIVEALEQHGIRCWIAPRDVTAGASYAGQIIHAIDAAKASVLILSHDAASSPHVLREVERSASKRHPIVSLRVDQAPLSADFEYFLNTSHWLDTNAGDIGRALPKLIAAVQAAVELPAVMPARALASHAPATLQSAQPRMRAASVVASLIGLGLVTFAIDRLWLSSHRAAATPALGEPTSAPVPAVAVAGVAEKSLAVLPFVDMSEKKDQEYLADGLSEEIIDHLAHVADLKVIARTSSFQFKGKNEDIRVIGARLGVTNLLEGSVRRSGNVIRVTAQLIKVADGAQRWSETYDRKLGDIFKVQDEIAAAVVTELQAKLSSLPLVADGSRSTNVDAYDQYLIGRHLMARTGFSNYQQAAKAFQSAVALDSGFAAAYVGLADAQYLIEAESGALTPASYSRIEAQLNHAIKLAPDLPDGYSGRGVDRLEYLGDLQGAHSDLARALQLDPKSSVNQRRYGFLARCLGDIPAAVAYGKEATVTDPLEVFGWIHLSEAYRASGQYQLARDAIAHAVQLNPDSGAVVQEEFEVELGRGKAESILQSIGRVRDPLMRLYYVARAQFSLDREQESRQALGKLLDEVDGRPDYWRPVADIYAWRGQRQQALDWLERISKLPTKGAIACIRGDPIYASFQSEPRFTVLLNSIAATE